MTRRSSSHKYDIIHAVCSLTICTKRHSFTGFHGLLVDCKCHILVIHCGQIGFGITTHPCRSILYAAIQQDIDIRIHTDLKCCQIAGAVLCITRCDDVFCTVQDFGKLCIGHIAVAEYGKGDPVITEAVWGNGILPPEAERYFNTGTIVFNTAACRAERTWEKILDWYRDHYAIADRIEQDAWNALYWRRTRLLPLRWNFHDRLVKSFARWDLSARYWQGNPPSECLAAALDPAILHFWGPKKPWKKGHRPYRRLYHEAMRAVGETPPPEPLLAPFHDFLNRRNLRTIRKRSRLVTGS